MKPLDPRLLRHARAARRYIALTALSGALTAGLVVAQCFLIAHLIAPVIVRMTEGRSAGAADMLGASPTTLVIVLIVVFGARILVVTVQESFAHRAARDTVADLRAQVLEHAAALGPRWLTSAGGTRTTSLVTRGLDDLQPYFVRYLPQLVLTAIVTPVTLGVAFGLDLASAVTVAVALPLIPVFMILIGKITQSFAAGKLADMQHLQSQLLDLLAGLSTLVNFGREKGPATRVAALGKAYNRSTMATLRVAFLSGAVLEFLTSISVALVAVGVGMRMVYGNIDLTTGLICIMLAPEIFKPLRDVGTQFHAAADGVAAAERAFEVLATALPAHGTRPAPDLAHTTITLDGMTVRAPGRRVLAPSDLCAQIRPGLLTVLVGASGAGKSTAASVILGLQQVDAGRVLLEPAQVAGGGLGTASGPAQAVELSEVEQESWWSQISWVTQRPVLLPGTLLQNVLGEEAGGGDVSPAVVDAALATGLADVIATLPAGWHTPVGHGGVGLSVGQRQRVALTRALLDPSTLVVLDEPTAHLDARSEEHVIRAVQALRDQGRTIVVVAHRAALVSMADHVIVVQAGTVLEPAAAPHEHVGGDVGGDRISGERISGERISGERISGDLSQEARA